MTLKTILRLHWDRTLAVGAVLIGGLAFLLGWLGVSGTDYITEQLPYVVSGGLLGIALVVLGASQWISADIRDEWRKLDNLEQQLARLQSDASAAAPFETAPSPAARTRRRPSAGQGAA